MSALLLSAVDSATDKLTHVAHGLNTGDGPLTLFTPDGTYPGGTAATTDVYAIRVDADNVKLATSNANALLGTAIDLTTNGTGTLYLLSGIPYRRARTYIVGSELKSVDLNALQDSLEDMWNFLTGQAQAVFSIVNGIVLAANKSITLSGTGKYKRGTRTRKISAVNGRVGGATAPIATTAPAFLDGRMKMTLDGDQLTVGIVLNDDEKLLGVTADIQGDTAMTVAMKVFKTTASVGAAQLGATATSAAAATNQTLDSGAIADVIAAADHNMYVVAFRGTTNAAAQAVIGSIEYTTSVP